MCKHFENVKHKANASCMILVITGKLLEEGCQLSGINEQCNLEFCGWHTVLSGTEQNQADRMLWY